MLVILDLGLSRLASVPHYLVWWNRGVAGKAIWSQQRLANELRGQRLEGLAASNWAVEFILQLRSTCSSPLSLVCVFSTHFSFTYIALLTYSVFLGFLVFLLLLWAFKKLAS